MWAIEGRNGIAPHFHVAVSGGEFGIQQFVGLTAYLMRGAIIDAQGKGTSPDIHSQRFPGERQLKNALSKITTEAEGIRPVCAECGYKAHLCIAQILRFIYNNKIKG